MYRRRCFVPFLTPVAVGDVVDAHLQMVQDPTQFDVLVMPNLYGDILRLVIGTTESLILCCCSKYWSLMSATVISAYLTCKDLKRQSN